MDVWVRSQDKTIFKNVDEIAYKFEEHKISKDYGELDNVTPVLVGYDLVEKHCIYSNYGCKIAEYKSKERCLEIIDLINETMFNYAQKGYLSAFYEMPQE